MKFILLAALLLILSNPSFAQGAGGPPPQGHQLSAGILFSESLNDDFSFGVTTIKPSLRYRFTNDRGFRITTLIGALYNRIDVSQNLNPELALLAGSETFITIAKDEPRIDGVELKDYNFSAHRFPFYLGAQWRTPAGQLPIQIRALYEWDTINVYDASNATNFVAPKSFFEHGPLVRLQMGDAEFIELKDFLHRVQLLTSYRFRHSNSEWGATSNLKHISRYFKAALSGVSNLELKPRLILVARGQASIVSNSDRLNTLSDLTFHQETPAHGMSDIKTDRGANAEIGLRYYVDQGRKFAIRPFGHVLTYREVTPTDTRKDFGGGAGIKVMGQIGEPFSFEVQYTNTFGIRSDLNGIHAARLLMTYRFF